MKISPELIQKQVEIALVLEPILDKEGCTTRTTDLPGKPLTDFLIAAVNVGRVFYLYAASVLEDNNKEVYSHLIPAMDVSNDYKSEKNINFGLLVFMFVAVKSRLETDSLKACLDNIESVLKRSTSKDVKNYLDGFTKNATTSSGGKAQVSGDGDYGNFYSNSNLHELFNMGLAVFNDPSTSYRQVCQEYVDGFPTVKRMVGEIDEKLGITKSLERSYRTIREERPELSTGLLADLTAVALFLGITYRDSKKLEIT